jgi:hypothetical protein
MPADLILSNDGIQCASGAIVDVKAAMPSSGTYTAGSIVLELTTSNRLSGWKRLTTGSGHVLNTDWVYFTNLGNGTAVATTSGTSVDFIGIPTGVKRLTLALSLMSISGTSPICTQLGDSGGIENTGYTSAYNNLGGGASGSLTTGIGLAIAPNATNLYSGIVVYTLIDAATNLWSVASQLAYTAGPGIDLGAGSKSLSAVLDRIRLTTTGGVNTFDGGTANIFWEF